MTVERDSIAADTGQRTLCSLSNRMNSLKSGFSIVFPPMVLLPNFLNGGKARAEWLSSPVQCIVLLLVDGDLRHDSCDRHLYASRLIVTYQRLKCISFRAVLESPLSGNTAHGLHQMESAQSNATL